MKEVYGEILLDSSTEYTYERDANITMMFRKGITDVIPGGQTRLFGVLDELQ